MTHCRPLVQRDLPSAANSDAALREQYGGQRVKHALQNIVHVEDKEKRGISISMAHYYWHWVPSDLPLLGLGDSCHTLARPLFGFLLGLCLLYTLILCAGTFFDHVLLVLPSVTQHGVNGSFPCHPIDTGICNRRVGLDVRSIEPSFRLPVEAIHCHLTLTQGTVERCD